jgi:hypothetical protein
MHCFFHIQDRTVYTSYLSLGFFIVTAPKTYVTLDNFEIVFNSIRHFFVFFSCAVSGWCQHRPKLYYSLLPEMMADPTRSITRGAYSDFRLSYWREGGGVIMADNIQPLPTSGCIYRLHRHGPKDEGRMYIRKSAILHTSTRCKVQEQNQHQHMAPKKTINRIHATGFSL